MDIRILYCGMCGGRDCADRASAEISKRFGVMPVLEDVGKGRFEVVLDGRTIFSKGELGRFPRPGEIVKLLRGQK